MTPNKPKQRKKVVRSIWWIEYLAKNGDWVKYKHQEKYKAGIKSLFDCVRREYPNMKYRMVKSTRAFKKP